VKTPSVRLSPQAQAVLDRISAHAAALAEAGRVVHASVVYHSYAGEYRAETAAVRKAKADERLEQARRIVASTFRRTGKWTDVFDFTPDSPFMPMVEDSGMCISVGSGVGLIQGKTEGPPWAVNGVGVPVVDQGQGLDVSLQFMWPDWQDPACLVLSLDGPTIGSLIVLCQGDGQDVTDKRHGYMIQTRWTATSWDMVAGDTRRALEGTEKREVSSLRIMVHEDRRNVLFIGHDRLIGHVRFKTPVSSINQVRAYFQTGLTGREFKVVVDNLEVRQTSRLRVQVSR